MSHQQQQTEIDVCAIQKLTTVSEQLKKKKKKKREKVGQKWSFSLVIDIEELVLSILVCQAKYFVTF